MPPASSGYPTKRAIQRRHWRSISVAAGPSLHAPALVFVQAASASAKIPIIAPEPFTYPKCRGEPTAVRCGGHALAPVRDQRLRRLPVLRQLAREASRDLGRGDAGEHGTAIEARVVVGDRFDDLAPDPAQAAQSSRSPGRGVSGCLGSPWVSFCGEGSAFRLGGAMGLVSRFG